MSTAIEDDAAERAFFVVKELSANMKANNAGEWLACDTCVRLFGDIREQIVYAVRGAEGRDMEERA